MTVQHAIKTLPTALTAEEISNFTCRGCGLSDLTNRVDADGSPSQWVDDNWCSACDGKDELPEARQ